MSLPRHRPLLCLVTDRARLRAGTGAGAVTDALVALVGGAARGGVDLIQIRERDLPARDLLTLVERSLDAAREAGARVIVNDRADVAMAAGAHGVHLRADSLAAPRVRALAPPGFLVGQSVHGEAEALALAARGGLDYLMLGTLFDTLSKPQGHSTLGLDVLARVARLVDLPVLAIGGLTHERLAAIVEKGAAGAAAIGLFMPMTGEDPGAAAQDAARRARAAIDAACAAGRSGKLTGDRS